MEKKDELKELIQNKYWYLHNDVIPFEKLFFKDNTITYFSGNTGYPYDYTIEENNGQFCIHIMKSKKEQEVWEIKEIGKTCLKLKAPISDKAFSENVYKTIPK
ncbi:MAG TPA: hypothetical protein VF411_11450 [Bacteroidia bacterium]